MSLVRPGLEKATCTSAGGRLNERLGLASHDLLAVDLGSAVLSLRVDAVQQDPIQAQRKHSQCIDISRGAHDGIR
jgi:hypothetical protein